MSSETDLLCALVSAYATPDAGGGRQPILFASWMGGYAIQHHTGSSWPPYDEGTLDTLSAKGLISFSKDYRGSGSITPTPLGESVAAEYARLQGSKIVADVEPLLAALRSQSVAENILAWPVVRPVLAALRDYWVAGGLSPNGIETGAIIEECPEDLEDLLITTVRSLIDGSYVAAGGKLTVNGIPAEIVLTTASRVVLDGWPGAAPAELVENLIAVLAERARDEADPAQRKRWQVLLDTVRELGVSVTSEVLAKVLTGGHQ